jgi:hypothetical protein
MNLLLMNGMYLNKKKQYIFKIINFNIIICYEQTTRTFYCSEKR